MAKINHKVNLNRLLIKTAQKNSLCFTQRLFFWAAGGCPQNRNLEGNKQEKNDCRRIE